MNKNKNKQQITISDKTNGNLSLTISISIKRVFLYTIIFSLLFILITLALGKLFPDYFRTVLKAISPVVITSAFLTLLVDRLLKYQGQKIKSKELSLELKHRLQVAEAPFFDDIEKEINSLFTSNTERI